MKLIDNKVIIPVNEDTLLMINTLNGLIDEIDNKTYRMIMEWSTKTKINPKNEDEVALVEELKKRGYLISDSVEEIKIKENIIKKLQEATNKVKDIKENITLVLTYDCNFRCPYCFEANNSPISSTITEEMVDKAISMTNGNLKKIHLFGGEPLLPKTRRIIEYIVSKNMDIFYQITSNGYYLTEFIDILKRIKVSGITVTLDGPKDIHDSRRYLPGGCPTYDKILQGIRVCLENSIPIRIRMNLDMGNLEECIELRQILIETLPNAEKYLSFEMTPVMQISNADRSFIMKRLITSDLEKTSQELERSNHVFFAMNNPLVKYLLYGKAMKPMYNYCYAHNNYLVFDPLGYIYPCITAVGKKQYAVGTYFPDIKYKENSIYTRNIETISECRKCKYALLCGGGCPLGLPDSNDLFKPNCDRVLHDLRITVPYIYKKKFTK